MVSFSIVWESSNEMGKERGFAIKSPNNLPIEFSKVGGDRNLGKKVYCLIMLVIKKKQVKF